MAIERERKFLVNPELSPIGKMKEVGDYFIIQAGYFTATDVAIRVTIRDHDRAGRTPKYKICFKSPGGLERQEFEYSIPPEDALQLMKLAPKVLTKRRYEYAGWEIDEFEGLTTMWEKHPATIPTLYYAEYEDAEGKTPFEKLNGLPDWLGREVTSEPIHSNQKLCALYGKKL